MEIELYSPFPRSLAACLLTGNNPRQFLQSSYKGIEAATTFLVGTDTLLCKGFLVVMVFQTLLVST